MSYAMFDFQMIEERNTASMEVEPGSFYVGFSFGRYGLLSLTFIDGNGRTKSHHGFLSRSGR
uniref:Uncharacterized protein n=1 Tax=Pseudomonas phage Baskent_P2_ICU TaxID=3235054 RepID=A0AB39AIC5_9CAUD